MSNHNIGNDDKNIIMLFYLILKHFKTGVLLIVVVKSVYITIVMYSGT